MDVFTITALSLTSKMMQGGKALVLLESCVVAVDCHSIDGVPLKNKKKL
jgi:hypothetical protein